MPKGEYQVEFKFEPQSVALGSSISLGFFYFDLFTIEFCSISDNKV
ncbi:MAG: hypothetical protein CM15mP23_21230 [Cryomorphaceae bacterium]|nr:MAG: hypothetical protein CM15mP23_21230 [Cryomorphaceae bacterium]